MPDKKLTDKEIVKALNTALGMEHISIYCVNIKDEVRRIKVLDIIDLINRLQAENERLEEENKILKRDNNFNESGLFNLLYGALVFTKTFEDYNKFKKDFKAEAYKECIGKAKENCEVCEVDGELKVVITETNLNNLLKELVGEGNG